MSKKKLETAKEEKEKEKKKEKPVGFVIITRGPSKRPTYHLLPVGAVGLDCSTRTPVCGDYYDLKIDMRS